MMKAAHVAEYYTAYLEGSLPETLREEVARHLESCPQCASELEEMRSLVTYLHELPEAPLPPDFAAGVRARVANRRPPARSWLLRLPALAGGTLAAVVLALAVFYVQPYLHGPSSRPVEVATSDNREKTAPSDGEGEAFDSVQPYSPPTASKPLGGDRSAVENSEAFGYDLGATARRQLSVENEVDAKAKTDKAGNIAKPSDLYITMEYGVRSDDQYAPAEPRKFETPSSTGGDSMKIAKMPLESERAAMPGPTGPMGPPGAAGPTVMATPPAPGMAAAQEPVSKASPPELADVMSPDRTRAMGGVFAADTRASAVGSLALRGIVLKGAEAAVTLETTAPAPTDLVIRTIEPAGGEGQGFPLSPDMRTAVFALPLQRGGSVVEIALKAGHAERAILVLPDRDAPQKSVSMRREESITAVLRRLAVAGQLFIFCPPQFIEDREASFTVSNAAPLAALSDLASQRGFHAMKAGNTVTLTPDKAAP